MGINIQSGGSSEPLLPLYEYQNIWAEESTALGSNNTQWSWGNGAGGAIGLPVGAGWEVIELSMQVDNYTAATSIEVALVNYTTPSNSAPVIASITLANSNDGGGFTNNAKKIVDLSASPAAVPDGAILGFITKTVTGGSAGDARVAVRVRRQIGQYRGTA